MFNSLSRRNVPSQALQMSRNARSRRLAYWAGVGLIALLVIFNGVGNGMMGVIGDVPLAWHISVNCIDLVIYRI